MKSFALAIGVAATMLISSVAIGADTHVKGIEPLRVSHGEVIHIQDYLVPGKMTIFDFYSDFCPPCRALKPSLEKLHASRNDIALVVVDINRPGVRGIDWSSPVARQYKLHSIPHLAIFGPDGRLVAVDQDRNPAARLLVTRWIAE